MIVTPIEILQLSLSFIVERESVEGFIDLTIRERFRTQRTSVVNTVSTNIKDIYANIGKIRYFVMVSIFYH